jgi:hypothetical protein
MSRLIMRWLRRGRSVSRSNVSPHLYTHESCAQYRFRFCQPKCKNARQAALRAADERATKAAKHAASDIQIFTPITPSRPRFVFEDVHMRYIHTIDKNRRGAEAERRRKTREEKMVEKTIEVMKKREERAKEAQRIARRRMMEERMRAAQAVKALKMNLNAAKTRLQAPLSRCLSYGCCSRCMTCIIA